MQSPSFSYRPQRASTPKGSKSQSPGSLGDPGVKMSFIRVSPERVRSIGPNGPAADDLVTDGGAGLMCDLSHAEIVEQSSTNDSMCRCSRTPEACETIRSGVLRRTRNTPETGRATNRMNSGATDHLLLVFMNSGATCGRRKDWRADAAPLAGVSGFEPALPLKPRLTNARVSQSIGQIALIREAGASHAALPNRSLTARTNRRGE
jgi:hypothetical protein